MGSRMESPTRFPVHLRARRLPEQEEEQQEQGDPTYMCKGGEMERAQSVARAAAEEGPR